MSAFPTGNELADTNVLLQLSDQELSRACLSNTYLNRLCQNDYLWKLRLERKYPQFLSLRDRFSSYRKIYQWTKIQVYVLYEISPVVYNDVREAYREMTLRLHYDFDVPEKEIPPIERARELPELSWRVGNLQPGYIYALPQGEEDVGANPENILFKLPDGFDPNAIVSPVLTEMPVLPPDLFLTYQLYSNGGMRVKVAKLTPQHLEEVYKSVREVFPMNLYFKIQRSDNQKSRGFATRQNFFYSGGFYHLIIIKDPNRGFLLAELPVEYRNMQVLTQELYDSLQWKPVDAVQRYLV